MNANTNIQNNDPEDDCIAYACEGLDEFLDFVDGESNEALNDFIVDTLYNDCMGL
ncbi:hypothetical protein [Polaribacter sp. KT 15]|uniref:hypothetical protein n=1 Tax=Polaribacter sp. KT 15 TaxID=1896175 RepID=UPI00090C1E5B|nr:hypothetical protein [Polaribacter sp. KT 15]SHN04311.1 hypothetical protein SAMN05720268_2380 [Polaribacter sp. KT 15]